MFSNEKLWIGLTAASIHEADVCIMGIPFDGGASVGKGAALAPRHIRMVAAEDMSAATESFTRIKPGVVYDCGDVPLVLDWERFFADVEARAYDVLRSGKFALFLGGDHSVTIPLHKAFARSIREKDPAAKIGVIHFDAHFDLCDAFEGHKWSHANTERRALEGIVDPAGLQFLGIRVAEDEELDLLSAYPQIGVITANDVFEHGWRDAYLRIEERFSDYDAIYFTIDIDVLDPAFAPGTGTPVSGGLSSRELINLVRMIIEKLPVKAMDIVEVSPPNDINNITSWAATRIISEVFAKFSC